MMDKKKRLLIAALAFAVLLGGAYVLYDDLGAGLMPDQLAVEPAQTQTAQTQTAQEKDGPPESIAAPDFTVYDGAGNEVRLSDYAGKPVVLNFWASWCGPCQMEMPDFEEKYRELGAEIHFLMVNMTDGARETKESASAFIEKQGYTFPVLYDTAVDAALTYGVYSLPTTYFIDAQGNAVAQATGAINAQTLERGIGMIAGS